MAKCKKVKVIQVFLAGHDSAEISDELVRYTIDSGVLKVWYKDDMCSSFTMFPLTAVSMVRIFDEEA